MTEYIDRERVLDFLHHCYPAKWQGKLPDGRICHYSDVIDGVAAIPAADVEPVRHGEWVDVEDPDPGEPLFRCSVCCTMAWGGKRRYCPECGAKMDGEENDG